VSTPVPAESLAAKLKFARNNVTRALALFSTGRAVDRAAANLALDQAVELLIEVEKDLEPDSPLG
jgi:hypothetical protein